MRRSVGSGAHDTVEPSNRAVTKPKAGNINPCPEAWPFARSETTSFFLCHPIPAAKPTGSQAAADPSLVQLDWDFPTTNQNSTPRLSHGFSREFVKPTDLSRQKSRRSFSGWRRLFSLPLGAEFRGREAARIHTLLHSRAWCSRNRKGMF